MEGMTGSTMLEGLQPAKKRTNLRFAEKFLLLLARLSDSKLAPCLIWEPCPLSWFAKEFFFSSSLGRAIPAVFAFLQDLLFARNDCIYMTRGRNRKWPYFSRKYFATFSLAVLYSFLSSQDLSSIFSPLISQRRARRKRGERAAKREKNSRPIFPPKCQMTLAGGRVIHPVPRSLRAGKHLFGRSYPLPKRSRRIATINQARPK